MLKKLLFNLTCLNHDTNAVHKFISVVLNDIRAKHPNTTTHKLQKLYQSLSPQFWLSPWGRIELFLPLRPRDGIGDTFKRLTACASLQMTSGEVIYTPWKMFQWCQENFSDISFLYVSSEDINNHVNQFQLDQSYELRKIVPGTRSYHSFIPDGLSELILQRIIKVSFSTAF